MLEMLLAQHFTSSRFVSKPKLKHVYGEGGYDSQIVGYEINLDEIHDSEMKLFEAIDFFNRPASHEFVSKQLARLRTVMARASESNQDLAVLIDTYADHLSEFPPDIVKTVCDIVINTKKWFPLVSELRAEMESMLRFRKAVLDAFERCRNPLLANKTALQIYHDDAWNPPTETEKTHVSNMVSDFLKTMGADA